MRGVAESVRVQLRVKLVHFSLLCAVWCASELWLWAVVLLCSVLSYVDVFPLRFLYVVFTGTGFLLIRK